MTGREFAKAEKKRRREQRMDNTVLFWYFFTVRVDGQKMFQYQMMGALERIDFVYKKPYMFVGLLAPMLIRRAARSELPPFYRCHDSYLASVWGNIKLKLYFFWNDCKRYRETLRKAK